VRSRVNYPTAQPVKFVRQLTADSLTATVSNTAIGTSRLACLSGAKSLSLPSSFAFRCFDAPSVSVGDFFFPDRIVRALRFYPGLSCYLATFMHPLTASRFPLYCPTPTENTDTAHGSSTAAYVGAPSLEAGQTAERGGDYRGGGGGVTPVKGMPHISPSKSARLSFRSSGVCPVEFSGS
jgi:hypothetical protein